MSSYIAFTQPMVVQLAICSGGQVRLQLFGDIQKKIQESHPGVVLESAVQGWVFLRDFDKGLECYDSIENRTGHDDRWAGICYFQIHEDMRAVELFYRAIARGVHEARINLAHALGYIERGDEVIPELLKVDRERLSTYDKVLFYRVKSLHEETSGDLLTALSDAETAWDLVQETPQFSILAPDILSQLAVLNGRVGRAQDALAFIDKNIAICTGIDELRAKIHRAHILITLGNFADAVSELEELDLSNAPRYLLSIVRIYHAEAAWALGDLQHSIELFERAVEVASELNIGFEEFMARVGLALLHGFQGDFELAFEHLGYAESLVGDRSDRLYFRFREILLRHMSKRLGAADAVAELRTVAEELGKMGASQEQGWVRLHISYLLWRQRDEQFEAELEEVLRLSIVLQNPAFLTRELALLPEFKIVVEGKLANQNSYSSLYVRSLGLESLLLNDVEVRLPLRRGIEMLTYFLEHDHVNFVGLINDLFTNQKPRTAKSYFHQFRHQLATNVSGVRVVFDPPTQTYSLNSDIEIVWDVSVLRAGDRTLAGLIFLPSATSNWARKMNQRLQVSEVITFASKA